MNTRLFLMLAFATSTLLMGGCASIKPEATEGPKMSVPLKSEPEFPRALVYRKEGVDFKQYTKFLIEPVEIYQGEDAHFKNVPQSDQQIIADLIRKELTRTLQKGYEVVDQPGPGVLQMKFILVGVQLTQPALATITHLSPVGIVMNLGKGAAGQSGTFMGSVTIAGELYDSQSNTLVGAFLSKRGPDAMDLTATWTGLDAAKTAVTEWAERFKEIVDKIQGRSEK